MEKLDGRWRSEKWYVLVSVIGQANSFVEQMELKPVRAKYGDPFATLRMTKFGGWPKVTETVTYYEA